MSVLKVSLHLPREVQSRGPSNPTRAKGWAAGRSVQSPQSPLICSVCIPGLMKGRKIFIAVSDQAGSRKPGRVFGKRIKGSEEQGQPGTPFPEGHRAKGEASGEQISSGSPFPYLLPFQYQPFPIFQSSGSFPFCGFPVLVQVSTLLFSLHILTAGRPCPKPFQ